MGTNKPFHGFENRSSENSNGHVPAYGNWRDLIIVKGYSKPNKLKTVLILMDILGISGLGNAFVNGINSWKEAVIFIIAALWGVCRVVLLSQRIYRNWIDIQRELIELKKHKK